MIRPWLFHVPFIPLDESEISMLQKKLARWAANQPQHVRDEIRRLALGEVPAVDDKQIDALAHYFEAKAALAKWSGMEDSVAIDHAAMEHAFGESTTQEVLRRAPKFKEMFEHSDENEIGTAVDTTIATMGLDYRDADGLNAAEREAVRELMD